MFSEILIDAAMYAWQLIQDWWWAIALGLFAAYFTSATLYSGVITSNNVGSLGIRLSRFYRKGDYVTLLDGIQGRVLSIGLTHTKLHDPIERETHWVANADVTNGVITNHSRPYGHPLILHLPIFDYGRLGRESLRRETTGVANRFKQRIGYALDQDPNDQFAPIVWLSKISGNAEYWKIRIWISEDQIEYQDFIAGLLLIQVCEFLETLDVGVGEVGEVGFATTKLTLMNQDHGRK